MDNKAYWIWLQRALGAGSAKVSRILSQFDSIKSFQKAGPAEWRFAGFFTEKELTALSNPQALEESQAALAYCYQIGQQVLTPDDEAYPEVLRQIYRMPGVLYVQGTLPDVDRELAIAVVGTRDATQSGERVAFEFGYGLATAGAVVVSGGARGIDTAAHKGALQAGGKTICVLGCGIGYRYLMENASLREAIAQSGALVSEYPVNTPAFQWNFPVRNRILSGLCAGTLVVEAATRSGSLITAQTALEQNRDVFAVPCAIHNPVSRGANNLIKCGAKPATCPEDILEEYRTRFPSLRTSSADAEIPVSNDPPPANKKESKEEVRVPEVCLGEKFSPEAQVIFRCLNTEPKALLQLEEETGLSASRILAAVTELELEGKITAHSGRRYRIS